MLSATSRKKFKVSGTEIPNKITRFKAKVTANALNVRTWASAKSKTCSFSPLKKGEVIDVCDAIMSEDNQTWYYIKSDGKYGFVNAEYLEEMIYDRLINLLKTYDSTVRRYSALTINEYMPKLISYTSALARWKQNKEVGITCVVPLRWALYNLGVSRADGNCLIAAYKGSFENSYSGIIKRKLRRITKGDPIGMTTRQAIEEKNLKKGDIVAWKGITHTAVFSGDEDIFYEGGGQCVVKGHYPNGIALHYNESYYRSKQISEILRWRP